jgi:AcrR family transcriptional regulator
MMGRVPKLSDETRARRKHHILTSAWSCFSRNGFHATSMDDVIAASGMSSSAVYRYFGSKESLIQATTDEGLAKVRDIFVNLLAHDTCPTPAQTLALLVGELNDRAENPDYDMTRIALQTWAEALRDDSLHERARGLYLEILDCIAELAGRWRDGGYLPAYADTTAVAASLFSLMHGLIVMHHLVRDLRPEELREGIFLLGHAVGRA